jgi:endo-1,3-1,4-beta-glycanase ExoK
MKSTITKAFQLLFWILIASCSACGGNSSSTDIYSSTSVSTNSSSSAQTSITSSSTGNFTLLFKDDFDHFDNNRWQLTNHSWPGNLALFSADTVSVADGMMTIKLIHAPVGTESSGETKSFLGAEVRSVASINYGRVSARAKLAKGSAVVSALVTIYTAWPADNWNEFDIESLGKNTREIQFNSMVYTGPKLTPPVTLSVTPTAHPSMQGLGFDSSEDFHIYTIEWTPAEATFSIDNLVYHRWAKRMDLIGLPQHILMTIWASSLTDWAGPVTADTANAEAVYDWVEIWRYE